MITIAYLQSIKNILNLSGLAKAAGLKSDSLTQKVFYSRELTVIESEKIEGALELHGLKLKTK